MNEQFISEFEVEKYVKVGLKQLGIQKPMPVQYQSIKYKHDNIIAISRASTGKSLSYILPTVFNHTLLILPTHQLAIQLFNIYKTLIKTFLSIKPTKGQAEQLCEFKRKVQKVKIELVVGGIDWKENKRRIEGGVTVFIGSIGRIGMLIRLQIIDINKIEVIILDQFDKLFYNKDLQTQILNKLQHKPVRWLMYSATLNHLQLAKHYAKSFVFINTLSQQTTVQSELQPITLPNSLPNIKHIRIIGQTFEQKLSILKQILKQLPFSKCLIFYTRKEEGERLYAAVALDFKVVFLHSGLGRVGRMAALSNIKRNSIVISSDLLARGFDQVIDIVVQWQTPYKQEQFSHRAGRSGRRGQYSLNIFFGEFNPSDGKYLVKFSEYNLQVCKNWLQREQIVQDIRKKQKLQIKYVQQAQVQIGRWQVVDKEKQIHNQKYYNYLENQDNQPEKINQGPKYKHQHNQTILQSSFIQNTSIQPNQYPDHIQILSSNLLPFIQSNPMLTCPSCRQLINNITKAYPSSLNQLMNFINKH